MASKRTIRIMITMLRDFAVCQFFICCSLCIGTEPVSAEKTFELIYMYKHMLLLIVEVRNLLSAGTQYFDDNDQESEMKITPLSLGNFFFKMFISYRVYSIF